MGHLLMFVLSLASFLILCKERVKANEQAPPPTCDVKQVLWGMRFPVSYCRECHPDTCFMTKLNADAETQIKNVFVGLFYSSEHIRKVEQANAVAASRRPKRHLAAWSHGMPEHWTIAMVNVTDNAGGHGRKKRGSSGHDGDVHCPTTLTCRNVTRLTNIYGLERELVHLPVIGEYQWILEGKCAGEDEDCSGGCIEELTTQFLLVWNLDHPTCPMSFEPFDIKAYCSCKNIG